MDNSLNKSNELSSIKKKLIYKYRRKYDDYNSFPDDVDINLLRSIEVKTMDNYKYTDNFIILGEELSDDKARQHVMDAYKQTIMVDSLENFDRDLSEFLKEHKLVVGGDNILVFIPKKYKRNFIYTIENDYDYEYTTYGNFLFVHDYRYRPIILCSF